MYGFCKKRHIENSPSVSDKSHTFSRRLKMYGFGQKPSRSTQKDTKRTGMAFVRSEVTEIELRF